MQIIKAFKYKLDPTDEQRETLVRHGGNSRFAWNKLVEFSREQKKETAGFPNWKEFAKKVIDVKKENDFLKISHSQPIQVNAKRIADVISRAFSIEKAAARKGKIDEALKIKELGLRARKLAKAYQYGLPQFKRKDNYVDSIFYPQNFKVMQNTMYFAKIGTIKYIKHIRFEGKPKTATIKQDGKDWYCSIACEVEIPNRELVPLEQANIVGIDMGVKVFAQLSDGTTIENPKFLKKHKKRLIHEQRKLARKQVSVTKDKNGKEIKTNSRNRNEQILKLHKKHQKVRNSRNNFLHQETHSLITKYDGFAVETLDIQGLIRKNKKLHKKNLTFGISDAAWGEFFGLLDYKSRWNSKYYVAIDQYYPSTIECLCGYIQHDITLSDRVLICPKCGRIMDRDLRSSQKVKIEGVRLLHEEFDIPMEPGKLKPVGETAMAVSMNQETSNLWDKSCVGSFCQ